LCAYRKDQQRHHDPFRNTPNHNEMDTAQRTQPGQGRSKCAKLRANNKGGERRQKCSRYREAGLTVTGW
jgi:hypothetical protein